MRISRPGVPPDLVMRGIPARAFGRPRPMLIPSACSNGSLACQEEPQMGTLWHILVRLPNGKSKIPRSSWG